MMERKIRKMEDVRPLEGSVMGDEMSGNASYYLGPRKCRLTGQKKEGVDNTVSNSGEFISKLKRLAYLCCFKRFPCTGILAKNMWEAENNLRSSIREEH